MLMIKQSKPPTFTAHYSALGVWQVLKYNTETNNYEKQELVQADNKAEAIVRHRMKLQRNKESKQ